MSEMPDRVAKALRMKAAEIDQRPNVHEADPMWFAEEYARAAIEAMREPTDAMIAALNACGGDTDAIWPAMIDAALK